MVASFIKEAAQVARDLALGEKPENKGDRR
jgi:hypothetical protein